MRKPLFISGAILIALGAGIWAVNSGIGAAPADAPLPAADIEPAEGIYAPAYPLKAALTPQGTLTIEGRATPKSQVTLLIDGAPAQTVRVSAGDPAWEISTKLPPARIRRRVVTLTLTSKLSDDTVMRSEQSLIVLTEPVNFSQALVLTTPGAATRVLQSGFGGLLSAGGLTLEAADYDDAGGIIFSGSTRESGRIRMQAGRAVIGETGADANGRWDLISGSTLPVGTYAMRLQSISSDNRVQAQIDLPFVRSAPKRSPEIMQGAQDSIETVEPAARIVFEDRRWILSRPLSGGGFQHTVLYAPGASQAETSEP